MCLFQRFVWINKEDTAYKILAQCLGYSKYSGNGSSSHCDKYATAFALKDHRFKEGRLDKYQVTVIHN